MNTLSDRFDWVNGTKTKNKFLSKKQVSPFKKKDAYTNISDESEVYNIDLYEPLSKVVNRRTHSNLRKARKCYYIDINDDFYIDFSDLSYSNN